MKDSIAFAAFILSVAFLCAMYYGDPDISDALIVYLTRGAP